ncbi:hypothetical protein [Streptomyces stackebrandtii]|uniref:hypothetical protein n=1 Tax=Streptomyces stackebrandtii TaxID=3051177 RepID=UPI0028DB7D9F|nr:hypothetical protein [Streptomyces sp. DSM 40976]
MAWPVASTENGPENQAYFVLALAAHERRAARPEHDLLHEGGPHGDAEAIRCADDGRKWSVALLCREDDMRTSHLDTVTDRLWTEFRVEEDRDCSDAEGAVVQSERALTRQECAMGAARML